MVSEPTPRIRRAGVPDAAVLIVRGDELDAAVLEADAARFRRRFPGWGRFGVSAFVAADEAEIDALCETKLQQWATVVVFQRAALERSGVEVAPTFRAPHVTLAHPDLAELVRLLIGCEHDVIPNPYHEPEVGPLEAP